MRCTSSSVRAVEIPVVVAVILVALAMVTVVACGTRGKASTAESINNVRIIATLLAEQSIQKDWPKYDGKNFVLSPIALGLVDPRNREHLSMFFSPGDEMYHLGSTNLDRFREVTRQALASGTDFHDLTSYAGRRNSDREYRLTADKLRRVVPIICDDDDGPLHQINGLVVAYSDGSARFVEWAELDMPRPEDPDDPEPFLGDNAVAESLMGLSSD